MATQGRARSGMWAAAALLLATGLAGQGAAAIQDFPLRDTTGLVERNVKVEPVEYLGRKAVRLTTTAEDGGFAIVSGTDFQDGTIDADLALKVTTPPGVRMPGFIGIGFRGRNDASHFDMFYIRPGNGRAADQAMRNHAVQYVASPGFGWYELRHRWPWVYEAGADVAPETWMHIRIEVTGRTARLFVNGAGEPALIVDGMKGENLRGVVALWGYAGEEAYFSNLRITSTTPEPVRNGTDASGSWTTKIASDTGPFAGTLQVRREGNVLSGSWSGDFGDNLPVTGTWRDGYVEVTFTGEWPKDRQGGGGKAAVTLAGWVDGPAARGRMKVEGRADGQWTATRKE